MPPDDPVAAKLREKVGERAFREVFLPKAQVAVRQGAGRLMRRAAAGAPFLPKLAQMAKANVAFALGLMAMLVVVTIVYLPIVLPLLLPGVEVDAGKIALSLIVTMLVPLLVGLFVKAHYEGAAGGLQPVMSQISNISLALLLVPKFAMVDLHR
jgi:predicted Na+-dependent transporter